MFIFNRQHLFLLFINLKRFPKLIASGPYHPCVSMKVDSDGVLAFVSRANALVLHTRAVVDELVRQKLSFVNKRNIRGAADGMIRSSALTIELLNTSAPSHIRNVTINAGFVIGKLASAMICYRERSIWSHYARSNTAAGFSDSFNARVSIGDERHGAQVTKSLMVDM